MMREETVFGPIYSRRLGSSLGINLLPQKGKLCNFDCIYCECGWNRDGRGDTVLPTAEDLQKALTSKLEACKAAGTPIDSITFSGDGEPTLNPEFAQIIDVTLSLRDAYYPAAKVSVLSNATRVGREDVFHALRKALTAKLEACKAEGTPIDSITFSGDGEPTLNPDFARIIDITLALRDAYYPAAKVSVLSNATRAGREDVFQALRKVDNPILKIDAPTDALAARINKPAPGYRVADVVAALKRFEGNFVLQTMFLRAPGFDSSAPEVLLGWMDIVRELRPREVMVYTLDREAPMQGLQKFTPEEMAALVRPLTEEGFKIQIRG